MPIVYHSSQIARKTYSSDNLQLDLPTPPVPLPDMVRDSVRDMVSDMVPDSVRDMVRDMVGDMVRDMVRDSVGDMVPDLVGDMVGDMVPDTVRDMVGDMVRDTVRDMVRELVRKLLIASQQRSAANWPVVNAVGVVNREMTGVTSIWFTRPGIPECDITPGILDEQTSR